MKVRRIALLALVAISNAGLGLLGCAVAAEDVDGVAPGRRVDGGRSDSGAPVDEDTGAANVDSGSSKSDTAGSGADSTAAADSAAGTDSEAKDSGAPVDTGTTTDTLGGTTCSTLSSSDCKAATSLGSVSGDTGSGVKTATGTDSKFLRITVTEDDSSLFTSKDLRARITLTSTGGNFDLFVYMGPTKGDGGGVECTTVKSSSTSASAVDIVSLSWIDNRPVGGHDDTRVLSIEVRATMAKCDGASWDLKVEGNK